MSRQNDFIGEARSAASDLYNAVIKLEGLQSEWNALDYGNTLVDGFGEHEGYTKAKVGAVVFDTANAMRVMLDAGNATNLCNLL